MACCSAPPTSPTRPGRPARGTGKSSLAAAVADRRRQQGLPPLDSPGSPHRRADTSLATDSDVRSDPYRRRAPTLQLRDTTTIQRVDAAESEAMVRAVSVVPGDYGMFVSHPRQTRHGELTHWCQLYRGGTFRHGCTLGETTHEHMGPPEAACRFVVGSTVNIEPSNNRRTAHLALQCWQISKHALEHRPPGEQRPCLPGDWVQGTAMEAFLRTSSDPADPPALVIENWAYLMGPSVPPPDRGSQARRPAGEMVSWWNAAEFHSRMVWDPDRAPPEPPTQVLMPPAPIGRSPRAEPKRADGAASTRADSNRPAWRKQTYLLQVLDQIVDTGTSDGGRMDALRNLNELITLDPEAKQSFVERCSEDAALELAIRSLLPAVAAAAGAESQAVESPSTTVRRAVQAGGSYEVHAFSAAAVDLQGSLEAIDSGVSSAHATAARSAQLARLSNLM